MIWRSPRIWMGIAGLLAAAVASAQNVGSPPQPLLDASDIYAAFNLPVNDLPDRPPGDAAAQTQVGIRAQKIGVTSQSAGAAWSAAHALLARPVAALSAPPASAIPFNGSTASALNSLLINFPGAWIRVLSSSITIDQPILVHWAGTTLDLGATQLSAPTSLPYMIRIEGTNNITVTGGVFRGGNSAILVGKSAFVVIERAQISGLTGDGIVVTGSSRVMVSHNRISGLAGPGIVLNAGALNNTIEQNDVSNNLGQSNWTAAILVTDRDVDLATDPHSIFDPGGYWPVFSPITTRLNPPHDNLIAFNHLATNASSGIYMDGSVRNVIYSNSIVGNAKEGLCLDNGATANVVTSNTIQQNGNRWGQSDQTLTFDFVNSRLPDGTAATKLPAVSIDNALYNVVYSNNISHNFGGGVKMVRTGFFNVVGMNALESDNDGSSVYFRYFGVELGAAAGDGPSAELDFTPSRGNVIFSNLIRGPNGSGVFIDGGSDKNSIFDNVIMDANNFAIESGAPMDNTAQNNLTNLPSLNVSGCCSFAGRGARGR